MPGFEKIAVLASAEFEKEMGMSTAAAMAAKGGAAGALGGAAMGALLGLFCGPFAPACVPAFAAGYGASLGLAGAVAGGVSGVSSEIAEGVRPYVDDLMKTDWNEVLRQALIAGLPEVLPTREGADAVVHVRINRIDLRERGKGETAFWINADLIVLQANDPNAPDKPNTRYAGNKGIEAAEFAANWSTDAMSKSNGKTIRYNITTSFGLVEELSAQGGDGFRRQLREGLEELVKLMVRDLGHRTPLGNGHISHSPLAASGHWRHIVIDDGSTGPGIRKG